MMATILMLISSLIVLILGIIHFIYTFWGRKLTPRDPNLQSTMNKIAPVISTETTMWKAWVGFNASHSFGLILYGSVYSYLAIYKQVLFQSVFFLLLGFAFIGALVVTSKFYFFSIPFRAVCISFACYIASIVFGF
jgi:hypothetical protein